MDSSTVNLLRSTLLVVRRSRCVRHSSNRAQQLRAVVRATRADLALLAGSRAIQLAVHAWAKQFTRSLAVPTLTFRRTCKATTARSWIGCLSCRVARWHLYPYSTSTRVRTARILSESRCPSMSTSRRRCDPCTAKTSRELSTPILQRVHSLALTPALIQITWTVPRIRRR